MQKRPAWDESKVSEAEVTRRVKLEGKRVHFATLMNLCDLRNSDLEKKFRKYKGRVVSGNNCVFTEHSASSSHIYGFKKVLDVISR